MFPNTVITQATINDSAYIGCRLESGIADTEKYIAADGDSIPHTGAGPECASSIYAHIHAVLGAVLQLLAPAGRELVAPLEG